MNLVIDSIRLLSSAPGINILTKDITAFGVLMMVLLSDTSIGFEIWWLQRPKNIEDGLLLTLETAISVHVMTFHSCHDNKTTAKQAS